MIERIKSLLRWKNKQEENRTPNLDSLFESLNKDSIRIEVGADLIDFAPDICEKIINLRKDIANSSGFIFPLVRVKENENFQENQYAIFIREHKVFEDFIIPNEETCLKEIPNKLKEVCLENLNDIFTFEILEKYIQTVQIRNSWLISDISCKISMQSLKTILTELIKKEIAINDINYVFEKINETLDENYDRYEKTDPYKIVRELFTILN